MSLNNSTLKRSLYVLMVLVVSVLATAETALRFAGVTDFPVYDTDEEIGYVPKANQSGALLNKNRWVINDHNMNVDRNWDGSGEKDILLTGDSIVWGGNPLDDPDKLGAILQNQLPEHSVWPISAGSWSIENNYVWMQRNLDVINKIEYCVWVINFADLQPGSKWKSDFTHPRAKPTSSLLYTANKYIFPKITDVFRSQLPSSGDTVKMSIVNPKQLEKFIEQIQYLNSRKIHTIVVLYPDQLQRNGNADAFANYEEFRSKIINKLPIETKLIDLLEFTDWPANNYRDSIHPSVSGHDAMARIIASKIIEN